MILQIRGIVLDVIEDTMFNQLTAEIEGPYDFESIPFEPGDVVLDIGAHQGITSMYLAKRFPGLRIYAYEPIPENFERLLHNLEVNGVKNVKAYPWAVTADGRSFAMLRGNHSAEGSGFFNPLLAHVAFPVKSTSIPAILGRHHIKRVKLLKLDCEGAEHEILADSAGWMDRIDYVRGEIHMIPTLVQEGYTIEGTTAHVPADRAAWQVIENPTLLGL